MSSSEYATTNGQAAVLPSPSMPMVPYWAWLGTCARAAEPIARSAARANLELSSLAGQRMRAYAALPQSLAACRTPIDLLQAQAQFWQVAGRQYADASRHVMEAWQSVLPQLGSLPVPQKVEPRDSITFPEPMQPEAIDGKRQPGTRRAA